MTTIESLMLVANLLLWATMPIIIFIGGMLAGARLMKHNLEWKPEPFDLEKEFGDTHGTLTAGPSGASSISGASLCALLTKYYNARVDVVWRSPEGNGSREDAARAIEVYSDASNELEQYINIKS